MKFSVVTVTFNAVKTVEETIKSVSSQNNVDIEYIIIDGNSTDGTVDLINKYSGKIAYWRSEPDNGIYDAMNKALDVATGDYLLFMGADDVFYNDHVLENVQNMMSSPTNIYYGRIIEKYSKKVSHGELHGAVELCRHNISHQCIFYPHSVYKLKKYNLKYKIYADFVYNMELYSQHKDKFCFIDKIVTIFDERGVSATNKDVNFEKDKFYIFRSLFGFHVGAILWLGMSFKSLLRNCGLKIE